MARSVGPFEGWTKWGGGSSFSMTSPDGRITLHYDIAGSAIGAARSTASSSRPWCVQVNKKLLRTAAGHPRTFGSQHAARRAAEKALD